MKYVIPCRSLARIAAFSAVAAMLAACSKSDSATSPTPGLMITADQSTNAQVAPVGTAPARAIEVHVSDQNGAAIPGAVVTWTVVSHAGVTSVPTSMTDATGTATVTWTLDTLARLDSMTASVSSGAKATITATGTPGAATTSSKFSGDAQTVASGAVSAPLIVMVKDRYGNGVSGIPVAWAVTGGGSLSSSSTLTDASGMAQVTLHLSTTAGPYTIQATAAALAAVSFHLTGT